MLALDQTFSSMGNPFGLGRRSILSLGLASTLLLLPLPTTQNAQAAVQNFNFSVLQDGAGSFVGPDPNLSGGSSNNLNAGNDANANNGLVRTFDTIMYGVDISTDSNPNSITVLTLTITDDYQVWDLEQGSCVGNYTISADRKTLTCTDLLQPSLTLARNFTAFVSGTAPHRADLNVDATLEVDGTTLTSNPTSVIVSASPKLDLVKDRPGNPRREGDFVAGRDGSTEGVVYVWPLSVVAPLGSEPLADADPTTPGHQVVITDVVSGMSDNAELYNWGGRQGCAPNTNNSNSLGERIRELPYGSTSIANGNQQDRAVGDSGIWECSQSGPGQTITITITDADLSGAHRPTLDSNGNSLDADKTYLISGGVEIWIPTSDFLNNNESLNVVNYYDFLDAVSITGQPNVEPDQGSVNSVPISDADTVNNDRAFRLTLPQSSARGGQQKYYRAVYDGGNLGNNRLLYPMTDIRSGDGVVTPNQIFGSYFTMNNNGDTDLTNVIHCDKFDNRTQILARNPNTNSFVALQESGNRLTTAEVTIEYGVGGDTATDQYYGAETAAIDDTARYGAQRAASCDDGDATWYSEADLTNNPGLIPQVNRVRIRPANPNGALEQGKRINAVVHLQALNIDPATGDILPALAILANFVTTRADELDNGNWRSGTYRPEDHGGNDDGDRLRLTRAVARVTKKTDDPNNPAVADDSINTVIPESDVTFVLEPTLTSSIIDGPQVHVTITDTLPAELTYVDGSANIAPTTIIENPDGTTQLVWDLGAFIPGQPLQPIIFQANVRFDVITGTPVTNTVIIEALDDQGVPLDVSPTSARTAARSINVASDAIFSIFKEAIEPVIGPGDDIVYELALANLSRNIDVLAGSQFIDILPYEGDSSIRNAFDGPDTPPTDYEDSPTFVEIQDLSNAGFTFEYTSADPATISDDPNTQNPSTTWCTEAESMANTAGCPVGDLSDVTAIRIFTPAINAGDPTLTLRLVMRPPVGIVGNEIYTNNFKGYPLDEDNRLGFISSRDATVRTRVTAPEIVLVKRITAINRDRNQNPNDSTPLNAVINDGVTNSADDKNNWPEGYLLGEVNAGLVKPGDEIEYTVYFLNAGNRDAATVRVCDWIQPNQTFVDGLYGGNDIELIIGGSTHNLTAMSDATDRAEVVTVGNLPTTPSCNLPAGANNTDNVLVLDITGATGVPAGLITLPGSTGSGTPNNAYGFFRFTTKVNF